MIHRTHPSHTSVFIFLFVYSFIIIVFMLILFNVTSCDLDVLKQIFCTVNNIYVWLIIINETAIMLYFS